MIGDGVGVRAPYRIRLPRQSMSRIRTLQNPGDGVPDSVVAARGAGIRVVMITGDYLLTAIASAKNVARWQGCGVKLVSG